MKEIPINPGAFWRIEDYRIALDNEEFVLTFTFRARTSSWYIDVAASDGAPLAVGRRMSPGWGPLLGLNLPGSPKGELWVEADRDPYEREDLGTRLKLFYIPEAEADATVVPADPNLSITVTLP